jgi:hypothetical protein
VALTEEFGDALHFGEYRTGLLGPVAEDRQHFFVRVVGLVSDATSPQYVSIASGLR